MMKMRTKSGRYSRTMLLQVAHFTIQLPVLATGLLGVMPEKWSAIISSVLAIIAAIATGYIRQTTVEGMISDDDDGSKYVSPLFLSVVLALCIGISGCTTTCKELLIERHPHPDMPLPASKIIWKCGDKIIETDVGNIPVCLDKCFNGAE